METYAGIVLLNPELKRLQENISHIYSQVCEVVLVDNGSNNIDAVENLARQWTNIVIIKNGDNKGIAFALNQIINYGAEHGYNWGLTLDQDSVCNEKLMEHYINFIEIYKEMNIGCLACNIVDRNFNIEQSYENKSTYKEIRYCITSGSIMNIQATREVGGFDEYMFIDKVDCDICINLDKHGYKIIKINYNGLLHEIGHARQINLGFRKWELYNHSAFRRYYMCRNASYLLKKYRDNYVLKIFLKEIFHAILVLICEENKIEKLREGTRGFKEGFAR